MYFTLIFWLSFAFQVIALERVRLAWILRGFVAASLCFSLQLFPSPERMFAIGIIYLIHTVKRTPAVRRWTLPSHQFSCAFIFSDVEIPETLEAYVTLTENALKNISGRHGKSLSIARCKYHGAQA